MNDKIAAKQAEKRQQIIEAATQVIVQKGIDKTSLTDIAQAAGISKGSLYYYYATKNDLIFDITEAHINQISDNLFDIIENRRDNAEWKDILNILFERIMAAETRGRLHLYLLQQALNGNDELAERFRKKYREWNAMIQAGFSKIDPSGSEYTVLSTLIITALDGCLIQSMLGLEISPWREIINYLDVKVPLAT
ncbi:MAG TPA: TetR/AcrR family transcriptional regulator [Desulfosalsimonadaceae bacterium]|nr:TetR/AcrR family transcriptional regulator [Desulfosalsimonadaceae bacterium]